MDHSLHKTDTCFSTQSPCQQQNPTSVLLLYLSVEYRSLYTSGEKPVSIMDWVPQFKRKHKWTFFITLVSHYLHQLRTGKKTHSEA